MGVCFQALNQIRPVRLQQRGGLGLAPDDRQALRFHGVAYRLAVQMQPAGDLRNGYLVHPVYPFDFRPELGIHGTYYPPLAGTEAIAFGFANTSRATR